MAREKIMNEFINSFGKKERINTKIWNAKSEEYKKFRSNLDKKLNNISIVNDNYLSQINKEKERLKKSRKEYNNY